MFPFANPQYSYMIAHAVAHNLYLYLLFHLLKIVWQHYDDDRARQDRRIPWNSNRTLEACKVYGLSVSQKEDTY